MSEVKFTRAHAHQLGGRIENHLLIPEAQLHCFCVSPFIAVGPSASSFPSQLVAIKSTSALTSHRVS